jgi:acetate kinase
VFTGGIGENAPSIRERICRGLEWAGLEVDAGRNAAAIGGVTAPITPDGARLAAWVIPTNEELLIARDTVRVIEDAPRRW